MDLDARTRMNGAYHKSSHATPQVIVSPDVCFELRRRRARPLAWQRLYYRAIRTIRVQREVDEGLYNVSRKDEVLSRTYEYFN